MKNENPMNNQNAADARFETDDRAARGSEESVLPQVDWEKGKALLKRLFTPRCLAVAFCAGVIAVIVYFILGPSRGYFHSDSADTLMWAKASYDAGALLNPDFEYACLLPFGGQLIMVPLIALFGVSMTAHVLGMLIFFALFIASLFFLFHQMKWGAGSSSLAVACILMILSGSEKLREIFWGHIIYYSLGLFFLFVGLGLALKVMNVLHTPLGAKKISWIVYTGLFFVWGTLAAANQLEIITMFSLPMLAALVAERFFSFDAALRPSEKWGSLLLIFVSVIGLGAGWLLGGALKGDMVAGYADSFSAFDGPDLWFDHFALFFQHWATLIGVNIAGNESIADFNGIMNILRILLAVILLAAPVAATVLYPKIKDRATRLVILAHWFLTALIMVGYIFGRLSVANWRLSPILATSAVVTAALCRWVYANRKTFARLSLIALIPILLVGFSTLAGIVTMPPDYRQNEGLYAIADTMAQQGWSYGYGTFWKANALTVISDSQVECRSITVTDDGQLIPYTYQQEKSWFADQEGQDTYFLLLDQWEYNKLVSCANPILSTASSVQKVNEYYVLTFGYNIMANAVITGTTF